MKQIIDNVPKRSPTQGQIRILLGLKIDDFFLFSSSSPLETVDPSGEEDDALIRPIIIMTMSQSTSVAQNAPVRPILSRSPSAANLLAPPASASIAVDGVEQTEGVLELADGSAFRGISFGAEGKSVAGECVFQTGMLVQASVRPWSHASNQVWSDTRNP